MSVWVMTSPLTIAVALTTDGMAVPKICGFCGSRSDWVRARRIGGCGSLVLLRDRGGSPPAASAAPRAMRASNSTENSCHDPIFP